MPELMRTGHPPKHNEYILFAVILEGIAAFLFSTYFIWKGGLVSRCNNIGQAYISVTRQICSFFVIIHRHLTACGCRSPPINLNFKKIQIDWRKGQ